MGRAVPPPPHPPAFTTLREAPQLVSDLISADCAHAACSGESLRCFQRFCQRFCQRCCQLCPTTGHSGGHQAPGSEPAGDTEPRDHLQHPLLPKECLPFVLVPSVSDIPLCLSCRFLMALSY